MKTTNEDIEIIPAKNQLRLFGYEDYFNSFIKLYEEKDLPNSILLSGPKGLGKSTFAYHIINYLLSNNEERKYCTKDFVIDESNLSYKLLSTNVHPNFFLIENNLLEKDIKIGQIRNLLKFLNKSFSDPQFQVPIYNLLADLRDAKYPLISSSQILISIEQPSFCNLDRLEVEISIPNGPDVDIANKTIFMPDFNQQFLLNGSDAVIKGFDIPSAFLNQEMIKIALSAYCKNVTFFSMKVLFLHVLVYEPQVHVLS